MKTDLMKFYKTCLETGTLPKGGLCKSINGHKRLLRMMGPENEEDFTWHFWAAGETDFPTYFFCRKQFTPLRQNIVLFMHEMTKK